MEWTSQNNDPVFYSVNVFPQAIFEYNASGLIGRLQMELFYNTLYNVSITVSLCGINSSYFIDLHYGESVDGAD